MTYDLSQLRIQQAQDQLEDLTYSYSDDSVGLGLWDSDYTECGSDDESFFDDSFIIPAGARGMRTLDYEPDTDDYEYMQAVLY